MVKPIDNTVSILAGSETYPNMAIVVGGDFHMTKKSNTKTDAQIIRMRFNDNMNGISNAYMNDKSTSLKNDIIKPCKKTTTVYIAMMNAQIDLHIELCKTYKTFDMTKATDKNLRTKMENMVKELSQLHLTVADKKAMAKAQLQQQIELLQQKMELIDQ